MDTPDLSIMLIGEPGSGKTRFAASCPLPYFIDADKGTTGLHKLYGQPGRKGKWDRKMFRDTPPAIGKRKPVAMPDQGLYEYGTAWGQFTLHMDAIADEMIAGAWPWQTIVWDSMTLLQLLSLNAALKTAGRPGQQPQLQDYGVILNNMKEATSLFTSWPGLKIMTAHVERSVNPLTEAVEKLPLGLGQFPSLAPMYFDEVYFIEVVAERGKSRDAPTTYKRVLRTAQTNILKANRSRLDIPDGTEANWSVVSQYL